MLACTGDKVAVRNRGTVRGDDSELSFNPYGERAHLRWAELLGFPVELDRDGTSGEEVNGLSPHPLSIREVADLTLSVASQSSGCSTADRFEN